MEKDTANKAFMNILELSLALASQKVRLFQCVYGMKVPAVDRFSERATSDPSQLKELFGSGPFNSGIACGYVSENLYLVGVDIDVKDGRNGFNTLEALDIIHGLELPQTWEQRTTSGGMHKLFWSPVPIRQGANVLGPGVDLRGDGGYLVGPGSVIDGKSYTVCTEAPIAQLPQWFIDKYEKKAQVIEINRKNTSPKTAVQNQLLALKQSIEFLNSIPTSKMGERNHDCYKAVCKMKDFGLDKEQMLSVLITFWDVESPLEDSEMNAAINSAFKYGKNEPGSAAPENVFDELPVETKVEEKDYIEEYNEKYFYWANNGVGRVCEISDIDGTFNLIKHPSHIFHEKMLPDSITVQVGDKNKRVQKSEEWIRSKRRREYKHIRFIPCEVTPKDTFNIWRGFHSKPASNGKVYSEKAISGFKNFLQHCKENICDNDEVLYDYLMKWTAHIFQKPQEKPPVSLVFQGEKGTGKNAFVDCLSHLIGTHQATTLCEKKTMSSSFNSMMENKLLICLDEAFFSGDKSVESLLKSYITSPVRQIERKGENKYEANVYDRFIILGNEERLVNATGDERRFAVFNVSNAKQNDYDFFGSMLDGIRKHGGDELLMKYFKDLDISEFVINRAPESEGLQEQKAYSLNPVEIWWQECLTEGRIVGAFDGNQEWPTEFLQKDLIKIFSNYERENFASKYPISTPIVGKKFRRIAPSCSLAKNKKITGKVVKQYVFCDLETARLEWNKVMKLKGDWE